MNTTKPHSESAGKKDNSKPLLIFDLDGTLIDSKLDLAHSVNATRKWFNLPPLDLETVATYVGNGAAVLVRRALGTEASEADVARGLEYFLSYYREHMLDNTTLYSGVSEALYTLHARGGQLAILTNKPVRFSEAILEGLHIAPLFFRVYGGNSFEQKKPHPIGIEKLVAETGAMRDKTWMVGDSSVDVRTARNAGVRACGVLYGFQPETFEQEAPDLALKDMRQLVDVVFSGM